MSVLFDCWTKGVVGALGTKLDEYEFIDGARLLGVVRPDSSGAGYAEIAKGVRLCCED